MYKVREAGDGEGEEKRREVVELAASGFNFTRVFRRVKHVHHNNSCTHSFTINPRFRVSRTDDQPQSHPLRCTFIVLSSG